LDSTPVVWELGYAGGVNLEAARRHQSNGRKQLSDDFNDFGKPVVTLELYHIIKQISQIAQLYRLAEF
jgi:hypothetical protein